MNMQFAFVFPGQGSQSVGMVKNLAESFPQVKATYQEVSDAIGVDLWKMVQAGPAEELNKTHNTQPAMLAASYSIWKIWQASTARRASVMAGHSFGEVSALACAQAMSLSDAAILARKRGQLMQNAVPLGSGAMAAVLGLADADLDALCRLTSRQDHVVEAVNYNAPGQVVVAGHTQAVEALIAAAKAKGARRAFRLPVSVPAHSSLMRDAAEKFSQVLQRITFQLPEPAIFQNATLQSAADTQALMAGLQAQLYSPVRWAHTVGMIKSSGAAGLLELGPGKVLTGLHKRIDKMLTSLCVCDHSSLENAITTIGG